MARRSRKTKSNSNPTPMIIGSVVAVALIAGAFFFLKSSPSESLKSLPIDVYYDNPSSIRGSKFSVTGEVISKLRYVENVGQAIQVNVTDGTRSEVVGIMVPTGVKGPNIDPKQNYTFSVEVKSDRWLEASSYTDR